MLFDRKASNVVEWVVGVGLFVLLAAPVVYALYTAISGKLQEIEVNIGS